jgi:hypothetical protein
MKDSGKGNSRLFVYASSPCTCRSSSISREKYGCQAVPENKGTAFMCMQAHEN